MEPTSENGEEIIDAAKVKAEVVSDEEPNITEGPEVIEEPVEAVTNISNIIEGNKFCLMCKKRFNSAEELLHHFQNECELSGTTALTSAAVGIFPSLISNSEPTTISTVSNGGGGISSSPQNHHYISSPKPNMEKLILQQKLNMQKMEQKNNNIADMSGVKMQTPILLPLTIHSEDPFSIRILGPPQVFLPVAVGRKTDLMVSPLLIDSFLFGSIPIPSSLPISNGIPNFSIPINSISSSTSFTTTSTLNHPSSQPPPIKRPRLSLDAKPLDLSMKIPKLKPPPTFPPSIIPANFLSLASTLGVQIPSTSISSSKLPTASDERPFKCKCGVEFTSEKVYIGHKNFYCPMRPHIEEENNTPRQAIQKFPEQCPHCDFRPSSSSNLSQHIREQHATIKAYICKLCGYRGFSARGIRAHFRIHIPELSLVGSEHDAVFNKFIVEDRGNAKIFSCSQCHQAFLYQDQFLNHPCTKKP